jgi:hypothetical protein
MKTLILFILASTSLHLVAKNDVKPLSVPPIKISYIKPTGTYVKLKFNNLNYRNFGLKYELKIPLNYSGISALGKKKVFNRFEADKVQYSSRFQNLEKLDLTSIVEKNKNYNFAKTNIVTFKSL